MNFSKNICLPFIFTENYGFYLSISLTYKDERDKYSYTNNNKKKKNKNKNIQLFLFLLLLAYSFIYYTYYQWLNFSVTLWSRMTLNRKISATKGS